MIPCHKVEPQAMKKSDTLPIRGTNYSNGGNSSIENFVKYAFNLFSVMPSTH